MIDMSLDSLIIQLLGLETVRRLGAPGFRWHSLADEPEF